MNKVILDACCGSRMFWFDKEHPAAVYMDCRVMPKQLKCDDWVYLYCKGYIHGRVQVAGVCYGSSLVLARSFAKEGCIRLEDALVYLHLAKSPGVIKLGEVQRNEYPVRWEGVGHPQNFIYLEKAELGWVGTEVPCSEDGKEENND